MRGRKPSLETMKSRLAGANDSPAPVCPDWLDDAAKVEWSRVVPMLAEQGILNAADGMILAAYCQTYSQWMACELQVKADGLMIAGPQGNAILHPAARHASKLMAELRRVAGDFGFSPATRTRINAPPKQNEEQNDFDDFNRGA